MQPERIDRYEILAVLGHGGMATVYRAFDPVMKREVALKVIRGGLDVDEEFRQRMIREAQAVAALEHPAVVPVYDFGEADGNLYMVMRLMQGGSLKERLQKGALTPEETLAVVRRLASALDEAHRLGIVHRDLKPGNVLFDRFGNAYLADFGVARLGDTSVTLTGSRTIGTPAYMSPEQAQGAKDLDGRSDVYALGAMIYQMLSGRLPYQGDTPIEVMLKHIQEPPPDLQTARPDLPPAVAEVIRRAMAKDRKERYPSAGALAKALEVALTEGRFLPPEESTTQVAVSTVDATQPASSVEATMRAAPTSSPPRRRRRWWLWILPLLLLLLGGGAGAWFFLVGGGGFVQPPATSLPTSAPPADLALTSTATQPPSPTAVPATSIPLTATPTLLPPSPTASPTSGPVVVGGADLLAFVGSDNNLYLANMDGSEVRQLTTDGAEKRELQWLSHDTLLYLSGKCVFLANVAEGTLDILTCFPTVDSLDGFRVSPDGQQVALSIDGELFIVSNTPEDFRQIRNLRDLKAKADLCATFNRDEVLQVRWAQDGQTISARVRVPGGGRAIEQIEVLRIDCQNGITRQHLFPGNRFEMTTFDQVPIIPSFDWDGDKLYVFNLFWRNKGYGDLYLYSRDTYIGELINPIGGRCCYRDPRWSPDGRYLLVAFQDMRLGQNARTALYLIPVGTWGTGMTYSPLPLPESLFSDPRVAPVPALRPSRP